MEKLIRSIESEYINDFTHLNPLDSFCSGGSGKYTGEAIALHLHNIVARVQRLEHSSTPPSFLTPLGSIPLSLPLSLVGL